jgi:hypothetical protein
MPDKKFCEATRKSYGENLERYPYPIDYNLSSCIADLGLQVRIRAIIDEEIRNFRPASAMNPLYHPPN